MNMDRVLDSIKKFLILLSTVMVLWVCFKKSLSVRIYAEVFLQVKYFTRRV